MGSLTSQLRRPYTKSFFDSTYKVYTVTHAASLDITVAFRKLEGKKNFCFATIDPRGRPQSWPVVITILTQVVRLSVRTSFCPSVRLSICPFQNFKIKLKSLPTVTVGGPSGSLMTPVLFLFCPQGNWLHDCSKLQGICSHSINCCLLLELGLSL